MYLKKLEISGFKSFAHKVILEFPKGMAAIVGPNGSGKSNVADAIRWVMGEQSLKSLRTKKGEELIFHGSGKKTQLSRASVFLVFDNKDHLFPLDFEEVILGRKIFRDGENQYFINNAQVRLKDIAELIAKAKLGLKGYSVISQGMSDAMLNAPPTERRQIFEEALGLKEFKLKKEESENKFIKTQENLAQTERLVNEIEPHLRFLKRQLGKVKNREEIITKFKELEIDQRKVIQEDPNNLEKQKYSLERELGRLEGLIEAGGPASLSQGGSLLSWQSKVKEIKIGLSNLLKEENLEKIKNNLSKVISDIDKLLSTESGDLEHKKEKLEESLRELDNRMKEQKLEAGKKIEAEKELERWRAKMEMIEEIDPEIQKEYNETQKRYEFLTRESVDLKKAIESLEEIKINLEEKIESQFVDGFDKIKKEFNNFFRLLFNGGEADIFLGEKAAPDGGEPRPVNTGRGIEIKVNLPNKKIKSLEVLSGGEKSLTSLALLFALVSIAHPPFLILDEIDAALDEANSLRFTKILDELKKKTQFVVITHNRQTMRSADILYGVAMTESGISKLLSLRLDNQK